MPREARAQAIEQQPTSALGSTEVHDLRSDAVDDIFSVFVAECGQDPQAILLVTDANGLFGLAVDTVRLMQLPGLLPPMLVIGVGYPDASTLVDTIEIRTRDLTPTHTSAFDRSGGADDFVRFLDTELRAWLSDRFPRAIDDVTYFGHSLGGLFGAYVLLTQPHVFTRFILSSPSLWWDGELVFRLEQSSLERGGPVSATAFIGIGGLETDAGRRIEAINLPDGHPAKPPAAHLDMVDDVLRFSAQLAGRRHPGLDLQTVVIADEYHATVPGAVLNRALRHFRVGAR